jgi:hypothetical protein
MTNAVSLEVFKLATDAFAAGQPNLPVHVFPFRMTEANLAKYDMPQWNAFWRNLKEGYDLFERTHRPPRVSVCDMRYGFSAASRIEGLNPGPIEVCPETAQVIADLSTINKRVAEQPQVQPQTAEIKTASISGTAAFLSTPLPQPAPVNKLGENFEQQIAPQAARGGISQTLTRQLPCSLTLSSCRRYAALREQVAHQAMLKLEEPEREKARTPKKKKSSSKKKKSRREYSEQREYRGEYRSEARRYSQATYGRTERSYRDISISQYE